MKKQDGRSAESQSTEKASQKSGAKKRLPFGGGRKKKAPAPQKAPDDLENSEDFGELAEQDGKSVYGEQYEAGGDAGGFFGNFFYINDGFITRFEDNEILQLI